MRTEITLKFRPGEYEYLYRAAKIRKLTMPRFMPYAAHCLATLILDEPEMLKSLEFRMKRNAFDRLSTNRKGEQA